jgi:hypothetical protein
MRPGVIADWIPKLGMGASHHLEAMAKVCDRRRPLVDCAKLNGEGERI